MMKVLVIYAHPHPGSFNAALREAVVETLREAGHEVVVRDLYALGFDPVLKVADLVARSGTVAEDIRTEQAHIAAADLLVAIHPIWWTGLPAIYKGYIDRVFSYGFAYRYDKTGLVPLLKGKRILVINTQGTPKDVYDAVGMFEAMRMTTDRGIYGFCGLEVVGHLFLPAVTTVDDATRRSYIEEVTRTIRRL
ncbi:MAG: NAD(P)H-dependent oxidoreductase [Syntrophales bacterium]|nr:NAD(P)H-dependent oxidoreductase [Syntrophales bacterium]